MVELLNATVRLAVMRRAWRADLVRVRVRVRVRGVGLRLGLGLDIGGRTMPHVVQNLNSNSTPLISCIRRTSSAGTDHPGAARGITPGSESAAMLMKKETRSQRATPMTSATGDE